MIVDKFARVEPGAIVAALVFRIGGEELPSPLVVAREIRLLTSAPTIARYDLDALAAGWSAIAVNSSEDAIILGGVIGSVQAPVGFLLPDSRGDGFVSGCF